MLLPLALLSALYFKTSDGNIYHTIDKIPDGMCILNNNGAELVYEASNFNTCNEIVLQPGCYRAELRGGIGLQNEYCLSIAEQDFTPTISAIFSINEPTTVYVFRGGDGNPGGVNVINNRTGAFGGGASGVDSILVVGDRVWRASGGAGKTCVATRYHLNGATSSSSVSVGNGIGGGATSKISTQSRLYLQQISALRFEVYGIGGGGGASPNGAGGTDWQFHSAFINADEYVNAGTNGTDERGGNGGDIYSCNNPSCTSMVSATGGTGGATVTYECGGQTAKSYGGGGGGGAYNGSNSTAANGGNGGSGSTGTSDTSFVRIYRI
ncbi:MAG: hypothetical protein E7007_02890 [Alphaproteobacteria bacterium]|nr:hypothetical protein [Alphaproteobacteria bacterium]